MTEIERDYVEHATKDLLGVVHEIFVVEHAKDMACAPILKRALALLPELHLNPQRPLPLQQSVCRHLPRALDLGEAGPVAPVAKAIRKLEPTLHWRQNPKYNAENMGAGFMDGYAFTDFGIVGSSVLYLGVVLLGPRVTYPLTTYPTSEGVFLVIGGSPEWKCGDGSWARIEAGHVIGRDMGGAEGKRTGSEPMLALYAWLY